MLRIIALVASAFVIATSAAIAADNPQPPRTGGTVLADESLLRDTPWTTEPPIEYHEVYAPADVRLLSQIVTTRKKLRVCQSWLGQRLPKVAHRERQDRTIEEHYTFLDALVTKTKTCSRERRMWIARDNNLGLAISYAARISGASSAWLWSCNEDEGGNVARWKLAISLVRGTGKGWNAGGAGTPAFGPWQFMLDGKGDYGNEPGEWGTFDRMAGWAWASFARRVPRRFFRPDSYVGQALAASAGYVNGRTSEWAGAGC